MAKGKCAALNKILFLKLLLETSYVAKLLRFGLPSA